MDKKAKKEIESAIDIEEEPVPSFTFSYKKEGVFLSDYSSEKSSDLLESILEYIKTKDIQDADINQIKTHINEGSVESIKIAPPQEEKLIDERIEIEISKDKMECFIILHKAYGGKEITKEAVKKKLTENGIIYGLKDESIINLLNNKQYNSKILVAKGKKPENGEDARLVYYFDLEGSSTPQVLEDGSVDFKRLNIIKNVKEGDVLAEIIPPTDGVNGLDVSGAEITALSGKSLIFKKGKNTKESDDGTVLYASCDGQVIFKDGAITVNEVLEISNDVDNSTGNIQFNGKVIIKGNVKSGFTIDANGDIIVYGVVEGAKLKANGDIVLNRGVQGNNQATLVAEGNLIAKYIENTYIDVQRNIEADCILHSFATAKSKVIIAGKKGLIAGGEVKAGEEITAMVIGSHMGTNTKLEVGIDPELKERRSCLKNELVETEKKLEELNKSINLLNKLRKTTKLPKEKEELFFKTLKAHEVLKERHTILLNDISKLESKTETTVEGKIHVSKTIYPGVRATILNTTRQIYDEISNCTLSLKEGEVVIGPYEK